MELAKQLQKLAEKEAMQRLEASNVEQPLINTIPSQNNQKQEEEPVK